VYTKILKIRSETRRALADAALLRKLVIIARLQIGLFVAGVVHFLSGTDVKVPSVSDGAAITLVDDIGAVGPVRMRDRVSNTVLSPRQDAWGGSPLFLECTG
jgi:hypothetical protein